MRRIEEKKGFVPLIEYIPLQQGLRQKVMREMQSLGLIEYIPLQQGLRLGLNSELINSILIEYIPLQQGLRPKNSKKVLKFNYTH